MDIPSRVRGCFPFIWRIAFVGMVASLLPAARGDEPEPARPAPKDPAGEEQAAVGSLRRMLERIASLRMERGAEGMARPVELVETAILRYSNPSGLTVTTDGAVWIWGKTGRPVAINAIFFERLATGDPKWSCELTALVDEPLSLLSRAGWKWEPPRSDLQWKPFPDTPASGGAGTAGSAAAGTATAGTAATTAGRVAVATTAAERTRQMKDLARQFTASETFNASQTDQLRLLIRPLHRYADPEQGLLDGALFAFTSGTNPEVLLLLEARRDSGGETSWHFAFARMGAAASQARLGEKPVWSCPPIDVWDNRHSYFSSFGSDLEVFDHEQPGANPGPVSPIPDGSR